MQVPIKVDSPLPLEIWTIISSFRPPRQKTQRGKRLRESLAEELVERKNAPLLQPPSSAVPVSPANVPLLSSPSVVTPQTQSCSLFLTYLCARLRYRSLGITATGTWTNANAMSAKVELDDVLAAGVKAEYLGAFAPKTGLKAQKGARLWRVHARHRQRQCDRRRCRCS